MTGIALHYRALTDVARDIRARRISPVEVTEAILARIEALDPTLRSYTTITRDLAMVQARAAEREIVAGKYRSPLHGIPVAVKDVCFTRGVVTTAGMAIRRESVPEFDATVIVRLADAGAVLLGKLHMTEGASFNHHPEMHPRRSAPQSSSGPVCHPPDRVSRRLRDFVSRVWGPIRGPPSGFRPPAMRSRASSRPGVGSADMVFSRWPRLSIRSGPWRARQPTLRRCWSVIAGFGSRGSNQPQCEPVPDYLGALEGVTGARGLRIGIDSALLSGISPVLAAAIEAAGRQLAQIGADLREIAYPDSSGLVAHLASLCAIETAVAHEQTFPSQQARYGEWIAAELRRAREVAPIDIARGIIEREKFRGALKRLLSQVDVVLLPVLSMETPSWDELAALGKDVFNFVRFNMPINAAGAPAVALPCGFTAAGRPLGMQLVGPHCSEATLLRAAHAYQQVTDWHLRRPL